MELHHGVGIVAWMWIALVILTVGAVALFVKTGRKRRWVLVAVGLVVICALAAHTGLVPIRGWQPVRGRPVVQMLKYETVETDAPGMSVETYRDTQTRMWPDPMFSSASKWRWPVEIDPEFKPDVYPSACLAARAVASEVAESLSEVVPDGRHPKVIQVFGKVEPKVLSAAAEAFARQAQMPKVVAHAVLSERDVDRILQEDQQAVIIEIDIRPETRSDRTARASGTTILHKGSGDLQMRAKGVVGELVRHVRFANKPWAANFGEFVSGDSKRRWVFAESPQPCATQYEAEQKALEDAARKLLPVVRGHLGARIRSPWLRSSLADAERLRRDIMGELMLRRGDRGETIVSDRFVQRFQRPYGPVWREAVLVDASTDRIRRLATACERSIRSRQRSWAELGVSIGGLFLLICLVYLFLNSATKGYFIWSLRTGAVAVLIVGTLVALLLV